MFFLIRRWKSTTRPILKQIEQSNLNLVCNCRFKRGGFPTKKGNHHNLYNIMFIDNLILKVIL